MRKKEAILKAAIQLFAERGFSATATSMIAKRAGVAEGTIFHHFKTKEGILMSIIDEMMESYIQEIKSRLKNAASGLEAIEEWVHFHFRFSEERSEELSIMMRDFPFELMEQCSAANELLANHNTQIILLIKEYIEQGKKDGSIRALHTEKAAIMLRGMLNGISRLRTVSMQPIPPLSFEVIEFFRHGLSK
ncbi:MAG: TetR/AcrR family transcriptional regulator [Thermodesulfobacteriota bacterium]|nr:TetR/AcrR family transcriptional regulator [Thermodesulfobacteriota bacterium]